MRVRWKEADKSAFFLSLITIVAGLPLIAHAQWEEMDVNKTHLVNYVLDTVNDGFPLHPFVWNTTADPVITFHFNYTTALINGRLLTLLGKDPIGKDLTLFSIVVDHLNAYFVVDLQNMFSEKLDLHNVSVRDQVLPNANCRINKECNIPMLPVEQSFTVGMYEGDVQLVNPNNTKASATFETHELFQLHVILGKSDARPGLMSSGMFVIEGVEGAEADANLTILPPGGLGFAGKLDNLLHNGDVSFPDILKKLHNEFLMLDEKSRLALSCMPHEKSLCENAELCVRPSNSSFFKCVCREGFAGQFCQFSLFPPTCAEALGADPKRKPGIYQLDIDGSGPLRSTHAECLRDGRTIVTHNAPNRTQIRKSNDTSDYYYPINYRLFSPLQLKGLKKRSGRCEQTIRYECSAAPLDFKNQMTWFVSDGETKIFKLGSAAPEHSCVCAKNKECEENGPCNCASKESETFASDVGTFFDDQAGIQMLYVKRHNKQGDANITIGPLECFGDSGHDPAKTWTSKSSQATLQLGTKRLLRFFEFEFRTAQKEIPALLVGNAVPGDLKPEELQISLIGGHKLEFKYKGPKSNVSVTLMSQASLNDLKWHRLLIEIVRQEVRFSIDHLNAFYPLHIPNANLQLQLGNETNGFIGCVRGIRINNKLLELDDSKIGSDLIQQGCPNLCQQRRSKCEQNARCIEHFDTGTTSCECKNNLIHYGERCEKNINVGSEVSFHDKASGYLKYRDNELAANPLNTSMVFSVRTDQKRALFVYAHDQFDNFVQVHLENEYKIVLTMNNDTEIVRCAIYSEDSSEFSNMRWLQILVEQTPDRIRLHVDDAVCELPGPHLLANDTIEFYTGENKEAILPPQSAAPVVSVQPYHFLFVGGVPRVALERYPRSGKSETVLERYLQSEVPLDRYPRANKPRRRERIAYYVTDIPALLGCFRGFMLGEQLDLKRGGSRPLDPDAIQVGCLDECNSLQCANGGHCTVRWQERQEPGSSKLTECDCSKTSYYGADCTKDTGVSFGGQTTLIFNMTEPRRFFLDQSDQQSFQFTFAPRAHKLSATQHLATIIFEDHRQFAVDLCKNGSINVAIRSPRRHYVYTFGGNFTDGLRHFFQASFIAEKPILVLVDGEKKFLDEDQQLHLADALEFWFGGVVSEDRKDSGARHKYEGCMSNIDIDFLKVEDVHFRPLLYYNDPTHFYHKSLRLHPQTALPLAASRCARFKIHGSLPMDQRNVQFPVWEALFVPVPFNDTEMRVVTLFDSNVLLIYAILGALIFFLILLTIFCCSCCFCPCRRRSKSVSAEREATEQERAANGMNHMLLTDSITYIKPDVPLLNEQKASNTSMTDKEKTVSVASTGTYFTAPEQPQPTSKNMTESQITAAALDSDDETLTAYDDRPLSVISADGQRPLTSFSKSPPIKVAQHERSAPSLSTFMNTDELQPDHPLPSGRLSPYLPSLRSTLRRSQPMISPGQQRLIPVHTPKVPSGESLDSVDDSLKDL